jgi:von Willebrand factor type A domain
VTNTYKYLHLVAVRRVVLSALMALLAFHALPRRLFAVGDTPSGLVRVRIVGVMAEITMDRHLKLERFTTDAAGRNAVVELTLPAGSRLLDARVSVLGRAAVLTPPVELEAMATSGALRLVIERAFPEQTAQLVLRYRAPLACIDGHLVLQMPATTYSEPEATRIEVDARLGPGQRIDWMMVGDTIVRGAPSGLAKLAKQLPGHLALDIAVHPVTDSDRVAFASGTLVQTPSGPRTWVGVCRPRRLPGGAFPQRMVVLVDRSNSVSPAGMALERDAVIQMIQALPSDVRVEIVFFSRKTATLFPVERLPTTQFLRAFADAMVPSELGNGTALRDAILHALAILSKPTENSIADGSPEATTPPWLWVVTDGALDDAHTAESLKEVSAALSRAQVQTAIWVLRPPGDATINPRHSSILQSILGTSVGVFRMSYGSVDSAMVSESIADLRRGGDWFDPIFGERIAPGAGVIAERSVISPIPMARYSSRPFSPLGSKKTSHPDLKWPEVRFRFESEAELAEARPDTGELDRGVVRHGLSMSYLPRARACYLNRKHADASRFLSGRVRIGLRFERGELLGADVMASELGRPDIETCLLDAAYSLQVPRPSGDDFPVLAIVNLVFRPVTPQQNGTNSAELEAQLDIVLGPPVKSIESTTH